MYFWLPYASAAVANSVTVFARYFCGDHLPSHAIGFSLMDKDKDGYITLKDLRTLCNELNLVLRQEELDDMILQADMDGNGKVSKEEFLQIMLKTSLYAEHV